MKAIVAIDRFWGIGKNGKLLYNNKKDMEFFKKMTDGKVVVMGRKTFESLPNGPLKNRTNLVITNGEYVNNDNVRFGSIDVIEKYLKMYDTNDVFIIGGESIYKHFLHRCDSIYVTHNLKSYDADTFMPNLAFEGFTINKVMYCDDEILISEWITSECDFYKSVLSYKKNNSIEILHSNDFKIWKDLCDNDTVLQYEDKSNIYSLLQGDNASIDKFKICGYYRVEVNAERNDDKIKIASFGLTEDDAYQNLLFSIINLLK